MKCPKCHFLNVDEAKFCNACGRKLEISCSKCGKPNPPGSRFCNECGRELVQRKETGFINYSNPQSYTPNFLADKILISRSSIEGERKLVTVLFADVANYTSMSEKLDPEEVHQIMDGCFKILMDEIHKFEGTINQFTGDGVMALFGAPVAHENHAQRACQAALAIQKVMDEYSRKIDNNYDVEFRLRLGLNSGLVVVGAIGDDTTNLAMRMESTAEPGSIQLSENTFRLIKAYFDCDDLGLARVKGKKEPQRIYELIKPSHVKTRIEASVSKGLVRFVGRKNSMGVVKNTWDKAINGAGQVLGIVGEAGVGKSRILLEFRKSLENKELNYFEGRCIHYGGSMAYLPILDVLKAIFGIEEGQHESLINKNINERLETLDKMLLLELLPVFQDLLSLRVEEASWMESEPQKKQKRTFEALRNLFIRLSQDKPLILAVEDLHWMDKTSEEFINYFIDSMPKNPILLILLYRPEYSHQWGSKSYYNKIGLNQLGMESSAKLVSTILEGGNVATELKELILNRSAGNPLFMEEFTHTLLENGSIGRENNQFVLTTKFKDIRVPDTIQGIIAARMDRLEDNLKRTMQVASVIGRDFAYRILQTITGMREDLKSHLLNLQGLEFIYEKSLFPDLEYIFKHALTQEVAYNSLLQKRRKEIHEKIGRAIEDLYPERQEEFYEMLAYHYSKSDNSLKAYQYLKLSGKKATRSHANWEAIRFYREAIDMLARMPSTDSIKSEELQVRVSFATPAMFLSYPGDSIDILKSSVELASEEEDVKSIAKLNGTLSHAYAIKGESNLAIEHAEKCFQGACKIQDLDLMAPIARDLTSAYMFAGELQKAVPIFSKVIPLIEKANKQSESFGRPASVYTFLCGLAGFITSFLGSFNEAENLCQKSFSNAIQNNNIFELAYSEFSYGLTMMQKGNGPSTVKHLQKCVDYLEKSQMSTLMDPALAILGLGYIFQGDLGNATKFVDRAIAAASQSGAATGNAILTKSISAMVYNEIGNMEKAYSCVTEAVQLLKEQVVGAWEGITYIVLGLVLAKMGSERYGEAVESIENASIILRKYGIRPWMAIGFLTLGEIYVHSRQIKKAKAALKKAKGMFKEMEIDYWLKRTKISLGKI